MGPDRAICMRPVCSADRIGRPAGRQWFKAVKQASARKANVLTQIPTNASTNANVLAIGRLCCASLLSSCVSATFRLARIRHARVRVYETLPLPFPSFPFRGGRARRKPLFIRIGPPHKLLRSGAGSKGCRVTRSELGAAGHGQTRSGGQTARGSTLNRPPRRRD